MIAITETVDASVYHHIRPEVIPLKRIGVRDTLAESGPYLEVIKKYGMSAEHIAGAVRGVVRRKG